MHGNTGLYGMILLEHKRYAALCFESSVAFSGSNTIRPSATTSHLASEALNLAMAWFTPARDYVSVRRTYQEILKMPLGL